MDISMELDETPGNTNSQFLEEFEEITRKIAQSDRNNDIFRQLRNKNNVQNSIKVKLNLEESNRSNKQQQVIDLYSKDGQKNNQRNYHQTVIKNEETLIKQQKKAMKNKQIENNKLEKQLSGLQLIYEQLVKNNREKDHYLTELKSTKILKLKKINDYNLKLTELQYECENTKKKAEKMQNQLRHQLQLDKQLKELIRQNENELKYQKIQKQNNQQIKQQTKNNLKKMIIKAKQIEQEIDQKFIQVQKINNIHQKIIQDIDKLENQQKIYQEIIIHRREIINVIKKYNLKIIKDKQIIKDIKNQI